MAEPMVRIFDFATQQVHTIPARELAPGMIRVKLGARPELGEVYVDARQLHDAPRRHPPFPEHFQDYFRQLSELLADVCPKTPEQWEDGFRQDTHPWQEIEIWCNIAGAFRHFAAGKSGPVRRDIFQLIVAFINNGPETALATVSLKVLARKRAAEIVAELAKLKLNVRGWELHPLALENPYFQEPLPPPTGEDHGVATPIPIDALFAPGSVQPNFDNNDPRPAVHRADIIFGVDVVSEREFLVYGKETLDRILSTGKAENCAVLKVELDQNTDDLEKLIALVQVVKGRHDYPG
jgi:hypothetical protein